MTTDTVGALGSIGPFLGGTASPYDGNPVFVTTRGSISPLGSGSASGILTSAGGTFNDVSIAQLHFSSGTTIDETSTLSDPVNGYLLGAPSSLAAGSGGVGTAWTKNSVGFVPSRKTAFIVPTAKSSSIPAGARMWLDAWRLSLNTATASPNWVPPKQLTPTVVPTRTNYSVCCGFEHPGTLTLTNKVQSNFTGSGGGTADTIGYDSSTFVSGTRSLKIIVGSGTSGADWWVREGMVFEVTPGGYLSLSFKYTNVSGAQVRPALQFFTNAGVLVSTVYGDTLDRTTGPTFEQATVTSEVPANAYWATTTWMQTATPPASGTVFHVDEVLVEKTSVPGPYFDGDSGPDYLWQQGRTTGDGWAFFYENRSARNGLLNRVLQNNVPLGVTLGPIQYATTTDKLFKNTSVDFGKNLTMPLTAAF